MNAYIALLCEVGPAKDEGAIRLVRVLLTDQPVPFSSEDFAHAGPGIEAAQNYLDGLIYRSRRGIERCMDLRALPAQSSVPIGF